MKPLGPMANPPHTGAVLRDGCLVDGMTEGEAALKLGVSARELSDVLDGRTSISPRLAIKLEAAGWSNASLWMRLQAAYDLAQERLRQAAAA
ncbi:MAG: HigA family addiction module antitoxin [Bryobacterales bacterium]|nr:HigA family addiction module antitoxin [Bryobacterales bacterium]